jgi:hypothetical protein
VNEDDDEGTFNGVGVVYLCDVQIEEHRVSCLNAQSYWCWFQLNEQMSKLSYYSEAMSSTRTKLS